MNNINIVENDMELLKEHIIDKLKETGISQDLINKNMDVIEDSVSYQFDYWYNLYGIEEANDIVDEILSSDIWQKEIETEEET
jgi:hypothetical protein